MGTIIFDHCDLDLFFLNFNLANNFWTMSARAFIFRMSIPCDKTVGTIIFLQWPWPWSLTHFGGENL